MLVNNKSKVSDPSPPPHPTPPSPIPLLLMTGTFNHLPFKIELYSRLLVEMLRTQTTCLHPHSALAVDLIIN